MAITREAAELWLTKYGQAWEMRAPQLAADLFAEDCRYFETPFSEPATGRDGVLHYWQAVPEGQTDITFRYRILAVQAPTVIAHWSASFTRTANGTRVKLDGVFVMEFTVEGQCRTLREWWHREEEPASPGETMTVSPLVRWHELVKNRNPQGLDSLLSEGVVFHSPVVHTPQVGKAVTTQYLTAALRVFFNESFRYVREIASEREAVLEFQVEIDGISVNGVDMIRWDEQGKIIDFKVMIRPLKAINLIHQKMAAMLQAAR